MSESDAHILTHTSPRPVKTPAAHQATLEELNRQKQALDELHVQTYGLPEPSRLPEPTRKVWQGFGYELARKVRDELGEDWTLPGRATAALEQACREWVQKKGESFSPKSLNEGLRQFDLWKQGKARRQK